MSERKSRSLQDFAEQIESTAHPERELLRITIERVERDSPELAHALRYCAIPRRFDAAVIGILRDSPKDINGNDRILAGVLTYNFAIPRRNGGYVYHDSVREALLNEWRTPANREVFERLNELLVNFYTSLQEDADEMETSLRRVGSIVQSASPARYAQLAGNLETRILMPLLEAVYHRTLISPEAGQDLFEGYFVRWESKGRIGVCNALVNGFRDSLERLYPEDERRKALRWVDYYDARRLASAWKLEPAVGKFRELLTDAGDDTKLRLWVLGDLGGCLLSQSNLVEARRYLEEAVELDQKTSVDLWNLPNWLHRIASIDWSLNDLLKAEESKRRSLTAARGAENNTMVALSLLDLSGILTDRHSFQDAIQPAMEALHLARTKLPKEIDTQNSVLLRFSILAARGSPALLETLRTEMEAHRPPGQDSANLTRGLDAWIELLRQSGQVTRAAGVLEEMDAQVSGAPETDAYSEMLFRKGYFRSELGLKAEAVEFYTEVLSRYERGGGSRWQYAAVLNNRADLYSHLGRWTEAEADVERALSVWEQMGFPVFVAQTSVTKAGILRKQGKVKEAQALLESIAPLVEQAQPQFLPDYCREFAQVHFAQARWRDAQSLLLRAAEMEAPSNDWKNAVRHYGDLVGIAMLQGHWGDAETWAARAQQLSHELAGRDAFRPSEEQRQSDEENGRGMRLFCTGAAGDLSRVIRARELLFSAAKRNPENFWYRLNLAYASAELEQWKEAAEAIEAVWGLAPEWWCLALEELLNEYRKRAGQ